MPVTFNGQSLIPAPLVTLNRSFDRSGTNIISKYTATLNGTIVNVGNSLDSPGAQSYTSTMDDILGEQKRIRTLFKEGSDGGALVISSPDTGANTITMFCKVEDVSFLSSVWVNRCDYTIVLSSDKIENDGETLSAIENSNENWSVNENENGSWSLSHQIEAKGRAYYTAVSGLSNAIQAAKQYVSARRYAIAANGVLTHPSTETYPPSGFINSFNNSNYYWNYSVAENVDPINYIYSIVENFIYNPSGNAIESWNASFVVNGDNPHRAEMTLDGNVQGLANYNNNYGAKSTNASGYFATYVAPNVYTRLLPYVPTGYSLSTDVISRQVIYEYSTGNLRYTYGFNASKSSLIPNAIEEDIVISNNGALDIFAEIPVPGRTTGPIVQYMDTRTLMERSVTITAKLSPSGTVTSGTLLAAYLAKPNTDSIIAILQPSAGYFYLTNNTEEFNPIRRQYSRSVAWRIENEGSGVDGMPSMIHGVPN